MSDFLWRHELQHARLPCLHCLPEFAQTHVHWVSDAIQPITSVIPFSSCPQSFPTSWSFPMNWLFASGGQNTGASASASALPVNIQGWFPLGWTCSPLGMIGFLWLASVLSMMFWGHNMGERQNTMPRTEANQNVTHCVIPLTWEVQKRQGHRNRTGQGN